MMMGRGGGPPPGGPQGRPGGGPPPGGGPMGGGPPGHMAGMMGEKPKSFKKTFRTLLKYLRPYQIQIWLVLVFAIASTAFNIIGPKLMGNATTRLFEGVVAKAMHTPGAAIDFDYIGGIAVTLVGLYLAGTFFNYIQGWIMSGIAMKITYMFRREIAEKIKRMPLKYFDTKTHGEVQSRVANDVDTVSMTLTQNMTQIVTSVSMIIGILVMMLTISWIMTLTALIILPLSMGMVTIVIRKSQKHFRAQQRYLGSMNGHVEEMYGGHVIMKAFNGEEKSISKFDHINEELYKAGWKSQFLSGMMMPIMQFIGNLSYVVVSILGGYLAVQGTIGVGDILAFISYVRNFTQPIAQMANIANILQATAAAAERVFEFLEEDEEIPNVVDAVTMPDVKGRVAFDHIRFGYDPAKIIIDDFSAEVHPGQKVAIVGPTGAGKTTIVKLLMRFYDIESGTISVDGVDIMKISREELRSLFGMVLQDTWLFNGTVRENIRYGKLDATDDQVVEAAKLAYADHFIRTLPGGYDMELNEETSNISEGQKQLLTIARAFLVDPKILILDEATSSVDTRTEVLIQKAMEDLMKGRTSFVIAHRLSTIRDANMILVMKDGDIVEQGSHADLLKAEGFYATLYNSQFETGLVEADEPVSELPGKPPFDFPPGMPPDGMPPRGMPPK